MKLRSGCHAMLAFVFAGFMLASGCTSYPENQGDGVESASADPSSAGQPAEPSARVSSAAELPCAAPTQIGMSQKLIINEMMIDPVAVADDVGEWIEFYNPTAAAVDLLDWRVQFGSGGTEQIGSSIVVPKGGYVVFCNNILQFGDSYPGVTCAHEFPAGPTYQLYNGGSSFTLLEPDGSTISDRVTFSNPAPTGASMALRNPYLAHLTVACPNSPNTPGAWVDGNGALLPFRVSTAGAVGVDKGTPGASNDDVFIVNPAEQCSAQDVCNPRRCVAEVCKPFFTTGCCITNANCNDADGCTKDLCDANVCQHTPVPNCCKLDNECNDGNPCNIDICFLVQGQSYGFCSASPRIDPNCCWADSSLDPRTGSPWVVTVPLEERAAVLQTASDRQCDDKNICTENKCDQADSSCYYPRDIAKPNCCVQPTECAESPVDNPCTYNICAQNTCSNPAIPRCCRLDPECGDENNCTTDRCVLNQCRNLWDVEGCCRVDGDCPDDGNLCTSERCVFDDITKKFGCVHPPKPDCTLEIPYVQKFEDTTNITDLQKIAKAGWKIIDKKSSTVSPNNHWRFTNTGVLGHAHDVSNLEDPPSEQSFLFTYTPNTYLVKSVAVTPTLDASSSLTAIGNSFKETTLQWRMAYKDSNASDLPVTLRVVASATGDFTGSGALTLVPTVNGTPYSLDNLNADIEYTLFTAVVQSEELKASKTLKIGFLIDTDQTFNMDAWEIDDVILAAGRPSKLMKSFLLKCPSNPTASCYPGNAGVTTIGERGPGESVVPAVGGVGDRFRVLLCMHDGDAGPATWQRYGFPRATLDSDPMDRPEFMTIPADIGQGGQGCNTFQDAVQAICDVPAMSVAGYFYCGIDVNGLGNPDFAGPYHTALVVLDESSTLYKPHSPFENQVKFDVELVLEEGYVVWSPNGRDDAAAVAIRDAIRDQPSKPMVQIIQNLASLSNLGKYKGIFAVLGIKGTEYIPSAIEDARLKQYLEQGGYNGNGYTGEPTGGIYLEGGQYFSGQSNSLLAPLFRIDATSTDLGSIDSGLTGRNFLYQYDFQYPRDPHTNYANDLLAHTPKLGGREIFRTAAAPVFATTVSFEGVAPAKARAYRTIGSSVLFSGIAEDGGKTAIELMGKYLEFLESGYPPCTMVSQCQDDDVCTADSCGACTTDSCVGVSECVNDERTISGGQCFACSDDRQCPDNWACLTDPTKGYCDIIDFLGRYDVPSGNCGVIPTISGNSTVACPIAVATPATVTDLQVQVRMSHSKRGDLKLTLVSPGGVRRILKQSDPLDTNTNGIYFTYDMGKPSLEALDGFNGSRLNGDWTLIAEDADVLLNNGFFQDWSLFAKYEPLDCSVIPCPDTDPCAPNPQCVNNECVYTSLCDDNLACTVDYCDPATHACRHDSIAGTGCPCENHDQCDGEACLESTKTRTCNPDLDLGCACAVIPGDVFEFGGLPDGIPDFNAGIELSKSLVVNSTKRIQDIRVRVKTSHPAVGNLRVRLTHGTSTVTLRNLSGGSVQGFHDIYDYDVVAGPGSLSDFTGLPAGGLWTLTVADRVSLNEGVLERVTLYIENAECVLNADCDDGIGCTADVCSASVPGGKCTNLPVVCGVSANPCEAFECDAADGMCKAVDLADGLACEDSVYCTVGDTCLAGVCTGGTIRDCSELNGICVVGVCNAQSEIVRSCLTSFTNGADCSDGELCTVGDKCNAVGQCVPGLSSGCLCPGGLDSECVDDGNKCNGVDWKCDIATFRCQLQDPLGVECGAASGQCSIQVCESDTGLCREQIKPNNTPCDDGLWCTIGDRCTNGFCVFDGARDCSTLDVCKTSTCSDTSDTCEVANKDDTTPCMVDGGGCGVYTCIAGGCTLDRPLDCAVEDPSTQDDCNDPLCTPVGFGGHTCSKVAKGLDSLGEPYPCMTDGDDCTSDICDAGRCVHLRKVNCWGGSCGGAHQFDEGDLHCGDEDYCSNGINLDPNGLCFPLPDCIAPGCVQLRSSPDLPIDDQILPDGCVEDSIEINNVGFEYVSSVVAKIQLNHSSLMDLRIFVVDPQGYEHVLWNHLGDDKDNFSNTFGIDTVGELAFPIPYAGMPNSGQPLCSLRGERAKDGNVLKPLVGTWKLRVCDTIFGQGGALIDWRLFVRGSNNANLNPGHRCEDAVSLTLPAEGVVAPFTGSTACGMNVIEDVDCGWMRGPERWYKFQITDDLNPATEDRRRVTVRLGQGSDNVDQVVFLKEGAEFTCGGINRGCSQYSATPEGDAKGMLDRVLEPGWYYLGIDTVGADEDVARFKTSNYSFTVEVKTPSPDGTYCLVERNPGGLLPDHLICAGSRCANGHCCSAGDCCPEVGNLALADTWCPVDPPFIGGQPYRMPALCDDPTGCQGHREDADCDATFKCTRRVMDDDSTCDVGTRALVCDPYVDYMCNQAKTHPPSSNQPVAACPDSCTLDADCVAAAHCDPADATVGDTSPGAQLKCRSDLANGGACNENSDCDIGNCNNGFCCASGVCCPSGDADGWQHCPNAAPYVRAATCSNQESCTGTRKDRVCTASSQCDDDPAHVVDDDCACGGEPIVLGCGATGELNKPYLYQPPLCPLPDGAADAAAACKMTGVEGEGVDFHPENHLVAWNNSGAPTCVLNCTNFHDQLGDPKTPLTAAGEIIDCSDLATKPACRLTPSCVIGAAGGCCPPDNPTCCCEDEGRCREPARCEPFGTTETFSPDPADETKWDSKICLGPIINGYPCNENSDCNNKYPSDHTPIPGNSANGGAGWCNNNICCAGENGFDECCAGNAECAIPPDSACDAATCQGHSHIRTCDMGLYACGLAGQVEDDSFCAGQKSSECGDFSDYYCTAASDQPASDPLVDPARCPDSCRSSDPLCAVDQVPFCLDCPVDKPDCCCELDSLCDGGAHCDPQRGTLGSKGDQTKLECFPDGVQDSFCDESTDCGGVLVCQMHYCCAIGGCCDGCKVGAVDLMFAAGGTGIQAPLGLDLNFGAIIGGSTPMDRATAAGAGTPSVKYIDTGFLNATTVRESCYNQRWDANETDEDCGGAYCPQCAGGKHCARDSDCLLGTCNTSGASSGLCAL